MKRTHKIAGAALAALLVTGASAAYADVLILRAVGPSASKYPAGQRLPDNARLVLKPGDSISVLRSTGTRVFRGPGTFGIDAGPARSGPQTRGGRIAAGAVRGDGTPAEGAWPTDLWHVNAAEPGAACFVAGSPVMLWRRAASRPARVSVTTPAGLTTRVDWPARENILRLPVGAAAEGNRITYAPGGGAPETRITLAELKVDPGNRDMVGPALLGRRCHLQLRHFIALHDETGG